VYTGDGQVAAFDFAAESRKAVDSLAERKPADLTRYAELLSKAIVDSLREARSNGRIGGYPTSPGINSADDPGSLIALLFLVGYYEGLASWTDIRFWHDNQELKVPTIYSERLRRGRLKISGAAQIAHLLYKTDDPRLAAYRRRAPDKEEDLSLSEAIKVAEMYIRACCDPAARQMDQDCASIGGHIHIATITPAEGFKWVEGYEPLPNNSAAIP
jgi:hypothetical protein